MTALAVKHRSEPDCSGRTSRARGALPGAGSHGSTRGAEAMEAFARPACRTRRVEAWKYTDLAHRSRTLEPATRIAERRRTPERSPTSGARIVLVDGFSMAPRCRNGVEIVDLGTIGASTPGWVTDHLGLLAASAEQPLARRRWRSMRGGAAVRVRGAERGAASRLPQSAPAQRCRQPRARADRAGRGRER